MPVPALTRFLHLTILTAAVLVFSFVSIVPYAFGAAEDLVTLYMPAFEGQEALGKNVATILNLEIWQTLRKAPTPNPKKLNFGRGLVVWDTQTLREQNFRTAEEFSREGVKISSGERVYPQLVLWGKARRFGDGVVIESFLTIPPSFAPSAVTRDQWVITTPLRGSAMTVVADLPRRRYEFSPIGLDNNLVQRYTAPNALTIYDLQTGGKPIGTVGVKFEAREHRGTSVVVESKGIVGLVHLPGLSRNEVVDFVGGIIRIFRGDWHGANGLFQRVLRNPSTPSSLKVDALLYQVFAKSKAGLDSEDEIKQVQVLAPYSRSKVVYSVMARLERLSRVLQTRGFDHADRPLIDHIQDELAQNHALFSPDDPWLVTVTALLNDLSKEHHLQQNSPFRTN